MHPNLKTPDHVRWYPYKTFEAQYNQGILDWLKKLAKEDYIPYSFFGTKKVDENDAIVGEHNCMSFTVEVLKKLNIFNAERLGEILSYPQTYPISPFSIFYPLHTSIAHDWFWLPESLKRLVDYETMLNKNGAKRSLEPTDDNTHEAPKLSFKRPKSDRKARVTVEKKIKLKVTNAFIKSAKGDKNKKTK